MALSVIGLVGYVAGLKGPKVMVWLAGELWFFRPTSPAMSAFFGAALLLIGNIVWLGSHYRRRFRADNAIAAACYFAGHFLIVRSLYI